MAAAAVLLAFGLGLLLPCVGMQFFGVPGGDQFWRLAGAGVGIGLTVPAGLNVALSFLERVAQWRKDKALTRELELKNDARRTPPVSPAAPAAAPVVLRRAAYNVAGQEPRELELVETRPARWVAWQRAAEALLAWYTIRRTLTSDALVDQEHALASRADWVALTDEWARVGLAVKSNGKRTELADPLPVIRARITSGKIEWTADSDPPALVPPPHPAGGVVVEARAAES